MNKIVDNTLRVINLWAKMEIIVGLVLSVIILGYATCPQRNPTKPSPQTLFPQKHSNNLLC